MLRMTMEWNRRKSARCLWATLVMTTFALCILFAFIILNSGTDNSLISQGSLDSIPHSEKLTEEECIPVCDSEGCILQSKMLLDYLQPAVNPCDNFNKFTCGSFVETFPDEGGSFIIRFNKQIRIKFKNILENLEPSPNSASGKMKIVYDSCIKTDSEIEAVPNLLQTLEEFGIKGWPHLASDFQFETVTLSKVIVNLVLHNENGLIWLIREEKPEQLENPYVLLVTDSNLEDLFKALHAPSSDARKFQIDRLLKYFNFDSETVTKIQEENEALHREIKKLKLESRKVASASSISENMNVDCSGQVANEWMDLCEIINLFRDIAEVNEDVSNKYVFIVSEDIHYMQNIFPLLRNFSDRAIANYLAIEVFLNHFEDLNLYFRLIHQNIASDALKLFAMVSPIERWQSCVDTISSDLTYALMYEFGKKEFTIDAFNELTNLTDELIHEVVELYSQQDWLSEYRDKKTEELRNYKLNSPSLKHFPTAATVNIFYDGFKPKNGNFLKNLMELRRFRTVEKLRNKIDRGILEKKIFIADASGGGGPIEVGLTLLQPPYFSTRTQRIFNLVSLGFTIAHEIGHNMFAGGDFQLSHMQKVMECITDQVSQYQFELLGKNLNGQQYFAEDVADNIAAIITDKIIERYLSEEAESFLPGLPFPKKQLLYISSAIVFCSATSKRKQELYYSESTHTPDDVRIYQRGKNSKIFSQAFDCPVGSFMNPEKKCHVLIDSRSK